MRRLLRILLTAATALSLVLFLTLVVMCVRSYPRGGYAQRDRLEGRYSTGAYSVSSYLGGIRWESVPDFPAKQRITAPAGTASGESLSTQVYQPFPGIIWAEHWLTQSIGASPPTMWVERRDGRVDYWLPITLTLIMPSIWLGLWFRRRRKWRQVRRGTCPTCGYDLRATPERCPECGTIPEFE